MRTLRIKSEYGAIPLWLENSEHWFENIDLRDEELNLTNELIQKIKDWDKIFQNSFNEGYPPDSGFQSPTELFEHNEIGNLLAMEVSMYLNGKFEVIYKPLNDEFVL